MKQRKNMPETMTVNDQSWKLLPPGMYMTMHIGEITAAGDTKFDVESSLNGLSIYLRTPYAHPRAEHDESAIYTLAASDTIQALAGAIMELPDA